MTTQTQPVEIAVKPMMCGALLDVPPATDPMTIDKQTVLDAFRKYGAVLIEQADMPRERFVDFTERFLSRFMEYVGGADNDRDSALGDSKTVLKVTGGNTAKMAIPLHGEMFYTEPRPATAFFACMRPADENGQTTICDGVALWNALPDDIRAYFEKNRITYHRIYDDDAWHKVYKTDDIDKVAELCKQTGVKLTVNDDGTIETFHTCYAYYDHPAGRAFVNSVLTWAAREYIAGIQDSKLRLEDGSELPGDMLYKINDIAEGLTLNVPWRPGTVAIVDNMRFMHGRRAYEDEGRDIIMRLSLDPLPEVA